MNISMPKACISCTHYEPTGWEEDELSLYESHQLGDIPTRTQTGKCNKHHKQAFCTEICAGFEKDPLIDVVDVRNRPVSVPHQEVLI